MRHLLCVISVIFLIIWVTSSAVELEVVYQWKYVDFVWNETQKQETIASGFYDRKACVLYDVDEAPDGRIFVTSVRDKGVPASVMIVTDQIGPGGPLLSPYPDWSWYGSKGCNESITGVYRIYIMHNYIFILDCGKIGDNKTCPPQLLIFDLTTDKLYKRIEIPDDVATNINGTGLLVTPIVYVPNYSCYNVNTIDNVIVFMSDIIGYGLVVYNMYTSKFERLESDCMKPNDTNFTINGESFSLDDGILGLTCVDNELYYAALSGNRICNMNIYDSLKHGLNNSDVNNLTNLASVLKGQTAPIASLGDVLFYSDIPHTSIMCSNVRNFNNSVLIVKDSEKLQFPSGMKIKKEKNELLIMTNRYQRVANNDLNLSEVNFRALSMDIGQIRKETHCFDFDFC